MVSSKHWHCKHFMSSATDFKNVEHNDSMFAFDFCLNYSHELNNTDITLPLATSQATKIHEQDINFHLYPTLSNCQQHLVHADSMWQKYINFMWASHNKNISPKWWCTDYHYRKHHVWAMSWPECVTELSHDFSSVSGSNMCKVATLKVSSWLAKLWQH